MSETESLSFSGRLEKFESELGLERLKCNVDILKTYLTWDAAVFQSASVEELRGAAFTVSRYALHLTDVMSRHLCIASGVEREINRKAATLARKYNGTSFEERKMLAINNNEELSGLYTILVENEMKSNRIRSVIFRLDDLSKKIENYLRRVNG